MFIYPPFGLFGLDGKRRLECSHNTDDLSIIYWKGMMQKEIEVGKEDKKEWVKFSLWLKDKNKSNANDFEDYCKPQWQVSNNCDHLCIRVENEVCKKCKKVDFDGRNHEHEFMNNCITIEE